MADEVRSEVTPERLMQFAFGYAPPLIIESAIRNDVFDVLDTGPKSVAQVSRETGASERGLKAIMNALVGLELLTRDGENYALTPESSTFLVKSKRSFFGGILQHTSQRMIPSWLNITEVVRTGVPAKHVNQEFGGGADFFVQLVQDIYPMSYKPAQALGDALALADNQTPVSVLDLAAGSGVWGIALAQKSPNVTVTAVDWPEVLEVTKQFAGRFGLADRFTFSPGDLLEADFGTGHTYATLGHILHSEGMERSQQLLSKVHSALAPGGMIIIAEMVPNEDRKGPVFPLIFAVNMLVNTDNGDTFTFNEMGAWLRDAGFSNVRTLDTPGPSPLILADKAK